MQDMTFEANESNYDDIRFNLDGTPDYYFNGYPGGVCCEKNDYNISGYDYRYYFKHFISESMSDKYKNGVDKVFFKESCQGFLRFIYLHESDEFDEPQVYTFDVVLKYDEKENIYKLTLRDIFIAIDFSCRYLNIDDDAINLINIIEEQEGSGHGSHLSLGNFRLITENIN
jgi:hypothetical protein